MAAVEQKIPPKSPTGTSQSHYYMGLKSTVVSPTVPAYCCRRGGGAARAVSHWRPAYEPGQDWRRAELFACWKEDTDSNGSGARYMLFCWPLHVYCRATTVSPSMTTSKYLLVLCLPFRQVQASPSTESLMTARSPTAPKASQGTS
jgi:hypothetical protein